MCQQIEDLHLVRDKGTGKSKGFAFLKYEDQKSTVLAVDNFNGIKVRARAYIDSSIHPSIHHPTRGYRRGRPARAVVPPRSVPPSLRREGRLGVPP